MRTLHTAHSVSFLLFSLACRKDVDTKDLELAVRFLGCRVENVQQGQGVIFSRGIEEPFYQPILIQEGRVSWYIGKEARGRVGPGQGVLALEGKEPIAISWEAGVGGIARCHPERLTVQPETTQVSGQVHRPDGDTVEVVGCGGFTRTQADGTFRMSVLADEVCQVWAGTRQPKRWGWPVQVLPARDQTSRVELSASPGTVTKALGIDVVQTKSGLLVTKIYRAAPGFVLGDLIVSVDEMLLSSEGTVWLLGKQLETVGKHKLIVERDGEEFPYFFILGQPP